MMDFNYEVPVQYITWRSYSAVCYLKYYSMLYEWRKIDSLLSYFAEIFHKIDTQNLVSIKLGL